MRKYKLYWVYCFRHNAMPPTLEWEVRYIDGELVLAIEGRSARATLFMYHVADWNESREQYIAGLWLAVQPALYCAYVDRPGAGNYVRSPGPNETYVMHRPQGFSSANLDPLMHAMTRGYVEESFVQSLLYGCRIGWLNCIVDGPEETRPPGWEAVWEAIRVIAEDTPGDNRLREYPDYWLPPAVHHMALTEAPTTIEAAALPATMGTAMRGRGRGRGRGFHPYLAHGRGRGRGGLGAGF